MVMSKNTCISDFTACNLWHPQLDVLCQHFLYEGICHGLEGGMSKWAGPSMNPDC